MRERLARISARLPDLSGIPPRRRVAAALGFSALLHLVGLILLLGFAWLFPESRREFPPIAEVKMPEIEIEILPPVAEPPEIAAVPKIPPVIDPKGLEKAEEVPEEPDFQSSQNMLAGSEKAGNGIEPLPSQNGAKLPFVEFKTQPARLGKGEEPAPEADAPSPSPAAPVPEPPREMASKQEAVKPVELRPEKSNEREIAIYPKPPTPPATARQEMAMLATPVPRSERAKAAAQQPELQKTQVEGSITDRRQPGVNAVKTPLGVYQQRLSMQVRARWLYYKKKHGDMLALGTTKIRFFVTQDGRVEGIRVLENDSNQTFANICEQSIREAEVPAPPSDLDVMKSGRLELIYTFTLYDTH